MNYAVMWTVWLSLLLLYLGLDCGCVEGISNPFEWQVTDWSPCEPIAKPNCCLHCTRSRRAKCSKTNGQNQTVPAYFCDINKLTKPKVSEACQSCPQDCVLTTWSTWSTCGNRVDCYATSVQYRTRNVLVVPSKEGHKCDTLIETRLCEKCRDGVGFRWITGNWTSCRKITNSTQTQTNLPGIRDITNKDCNPGIRRRLLKCVDIFNRERNHALCNQDDQPVEAELCQLPCDCRVSPWLEWGRCVINCHNNPFQGYRKRARMAILKAQYEGLPCPHMEEKQYCSVSKNQCAVYAWKAYDWQHCRLPDKKPTVCGTAFQRRTVSCLRTFGERFRQVKDKFCTRGFDGSYIVKPPHQKACMVPCPFDCEVGEWEAWSLCSQSCGKDGQQFRKRSVIVERRHGGKPCGPLTQGRVCRNMQCVWWYKGSWSGCLGPVPLQPRFCGTGERYRTVRCVDYAGRTLPSVNCSSLRKPPSMKQICHKPCGVCRYTAWSEWSSCSRTSSPLCGHKLRTRRALQGYSSHMCTRKYLLKESKVCNPVQCRGYFWQVSAWGVCRPTTQGQCVSNRGTQFRLITCHTASGRQVNSSLCDQSTQPLSNRSCDPPCPVDCHLGEWTPWSKCLSLCKQTFSVRSRLIDRLPQNGGRPCPNDTTHDGIQLEYNRTACGSSKQCHNYTWSISPYSEECQTYRGRCGQGIQQREIECLKNNLPVSIVACEWSLMEAMSTKFRYCFKPCLGDCQLSDWSKFSSCSQTCGETPGVRRRTHHLINPGNITEMCPHLGHSSIEDTEICGASACPTYTWYSGPWNSCIVKQHAAGTVSIEESCGLGTRRRAVLCQRNDGIFVAKSHCHSKMPQHQMVCHMPCAKNCVVTNWSLWSECSHDCDHGYTFRNRSTVSPANKHGRPCPSLMESKLCSIRPCSDFEWKVGQWSGCQMTWRQAKCGSGNQEREVTCPSGQEEQCYKRTLNRYKPRNKQDCSIPCPGDCLLSTWSPFGACYQISTGKCVQGRWRSVTRGKGFPDARCSTTRDTAVQCACPQKYRIHIGNWTTCLPLTEQCGRGKRERSVTCRSLNTKLLVSQQYCPNITQTISQMSCTVPCPEDCQLSTFNKWTTCSEHCGPNGVKIKYRIIQKMGNEIGRKCPSTDLMIQKTTCRVKPCYNYTWIQTDWSNCHLTRSTQVCGSGIQRRTAKCLRNDSVYVENKRCNNAPKDTRKMKACYIPCPADCQMTEWSRFGPCIKNCSVASPTSYRVRTRALIKPSQTGGRPCSSKLIHTRSCSDITDGTGQCASFHWRITPWDKDGHRDVTCHITGGLQVLSGCRQSSRPSNTKNCSQTCGHGATCIEGRCQCLPAFQGDGYECMPIHGCVTNNHCPGNGTVCHVASHQCRCHDGSVPILGIICNSTTAMGTYQQASSINERTLILAVSVGGAIFLVFSIIVVIVVVRCVKARNRSRHAAPPNNTQDLQIKNSLKKGERYAKNLVQGKNQKQNARNIYVPPGCSSFSNGNLDDDDVFVETSPSADSQTSDEVFLYDSPATKNVNDFDFINMKLKNGLEKGDIDPRLLKLVLMQQTGRLYMPSEKSNHNNHYVLMPLKDRDGPLRLATGGAAGNSGSKVDIADVDSELSDDVFIDTDDDPKLQNEKNQNLVVGLPDPDVRHSQIPGAPPVERLAPIPGGVDNVPRRTRNLHVVRSSSENMQTSAKIKNNEFIQRKKNKNTPFDRRDPELPPRCVCQQCSNQTNIRSNKVHVNECDNLGGSYCLLHLNQSHRSEKSMHNENQKLSPDYTHNAVQRHPVHCYEDTVSNDTDTNKNNDYMNVPKNGVSQDGRPKVELSPNKKSVNNDTDNNSSSSSSANTNTSALSFFGDESFLPSSDAESVVSADV